jgi:hypothetical protein
MLLLVDDADVEVEARWLLAASTFLFAFAFSAKAKPPPPGSSPPTSICSAGQGRRLGGMARGRRVLRGGGKNE